MNQEEFRKYIESIGFEYNYGFYYDYKEFRIDLFNLTGGHYDFWNGSEWIHNIPYNDLKPFEKYFKKELRSIKLKSLLR